jgi:hypothetical protein
MLQPHEFFAGALADTDAGTFVLPRTKYEASFLVGLFEEKPHAVFLDGNYTFHAMPSEGNVSWKGLLIPNIRVEVDHETLFNPEDSWPPLGALTRIEDRLCMMARLEARGPFSSVSPIVIQSGLPPCLNQQRAGFKRWTIILGSGLDRRELFTVDVTDKPGAD